MPGGDLIEGWEVVIGLEVHAQISSRTKLFGRGCVGVGAEPNTLVSLFDAAFPGQLPVVNSFCIDQTIKTGFGVKGKIHKVSIFDRKNYFYPDLPAGYQISQFFNPIITDGVITICLLDGSKKSIGIDRIHIEQDAGKSIHDISSTQSFIDLNRAGVPLMEIVSKPDIRSEYEAMEYVKKLRKILRYVGSSDCNMEDGNLRVDANVSIRRPGDPFGQRAEIKNLNSIRFLGQALSYEIKRQIALVEAGKTVLQETRLFDPSLGETRSMRAKEDAADYRYFHDPDLAPIVLSESRLARLKSEMPELPDEKVERMVSQYGLSLQDALLLTEDLTVVGLYEEAVSKSSFPPELSAKPIANWIIGDLFAILNKHDKKEIDFPIGFITELVDLILNETISGKIAKTVFLMMIERKTSPAEIVKSMGLEQIQDGSIVEIAAKEVLAKYSDKVAEYKAGKMQLFGFFVGQTMTILSGKANPSLVNTILKKLLS
jgi:aspartyl-tRNA(Asn)/glutamyl-tRNA(Gln) amidotransferase subunit B